MANSQQANSDQSALWNDGSGRTWVDMQPLLDRMLAPFETLLVEEGFPGPDGRVLDIGCGAGATTLAMARRLGSGGSCLGVDISQPLVDAAAERAMSERISTAAFIRADAQTHPFDPAGFDAVISRFGVMFFDDPVAAFLNIRRAARSGARLTFVAWRTPAENAFFGLATQAAAPFLPPFPPPTPGAPGQFAFADGEHVRRVLDQSGWAGVEIRPIDVPCSVPENDLLNYVTRLGPVGAAFREADAATRRDVTEALAAAYRPLVTAGAARFDTACWLVTGSA